MPHGAFELIEHFGEAILSGHAAMLIGAGLLPNAGLPGWRIYWSRSGQAATSQVSRSSICGRPARSSQALAQRCRIVLGCPAGKSNAEVASEGGAAADGGKLAPRFLDVRLEDSLINHVPVQRERSLMRLLRS